MPPPLLSVRNLKVELPWGEKYLPAVDGVDFDLQACEALGVVGESGCGKTLMARSLLDLVPAGARVSGSVLYRGRDLLAMEERQWCEVRGKEIAMVFQEPAAALDPVQTIGDQIVEAVRAHSPSTRAEALSQARRLLEEVSFSDPDRGLSEYAHRLSGGQRQRAFLAMALASRPSILIADEPTTALDATLAADVLDLFGRLRRERGLALLLITHDLGVVARHTDRALVLYAGRVVEESNTADLFASPLHPYTRGLLECVPGIEGARSGERFRAIPGTVPDLAFRPRGSCSFAPRCPDRFGPCERREPELLEQATARVRCFLYEPLERRDQPAKAKP